MQKDPVVERVRKTKREIARNFGYDIHKFAQYIKERQEKFGLGLVNTTKVVREASHPIEW